MTEKEWLDIGYDKNIIDVQAYEEITFHDVYKQWFLMKLKRIKEQSCDRIEVTFNKYYANDPIIEKYISKISTTNIIDFLTFCVIKYGDINYKEFGRIMQIINNVLVYAKDLQIGGAQLYDWEKIKRYVPLDSLESSAYKEFCVPLSAIHKVFDSVVNKKIYYEKQSACLCLCMNFYLGLRIGELASLTFNDFDFDAGVVRIYKTECKFYNRTEDGSRLGAMVYNVVEDTKTIYSVREIPIVPEVKAFYEKIAEHHKICKYNSPYLAYDGKDTILVRSLDRTLRRLCRLCEVDYFNSHKIRKTFASTLHDNGVPTRVISDLMGHSLLSTTENCYIMSRSDNYTNVYNYMQDGLKYVS